MSQAARSPEGVAPDRRIAGAVSAYRGYRRQALYALYRLLQLSPDEQLQPEGVEDLSVVSGGRLTEALQIKSHTAALTLSDLDPAGKGSFFQAAAARSALGKHERLRLVSFGPIGPELAGVRDRDERLTAAVAKKLEQAGIKAATASELLRRLEIERVTEEAVAADVLGRLGSMVTGVDPKSAFALLTFWMYSQSESRTTISSSDARVRVEAVGKFIAARRAHHEEWYVTIIPVDEDVNLSPERRQLLEEEFYQGVSVRYEHVAAGLAVERPDVLLAIDQAFEHKPIVVVHAPSGHGKTTIGFQFLSCLPTSWRFRAVAVPDRFHALRMAAALEAHATAVGLPVYVHIDVGPQDSAWPTLARELATREHLRILVTIREEDWRRSTDVAVLPFAEVDLTLTESAAREIFEALKPRFANAPPTFEESWARFGAAGPLLEFVHLVTQRQELRARLSDQLGRLRREAQTTDSSRVEFLRLASVIAAAGARADLLPLTLAMGLQDAAHVVATLQDEYLVRLSDNGRLIGGLHPIRSRILVELLTDATLSPLLEHHVAAVPYVTERDLEIFMLHALSTDGAAVHSLVEAALQRPLATWSGYAGVARAERWRGIAQYAEEHRGLIEEVDPDHSNRWTLMLNSDIAGAMPGGMGRILDELSTSIPGGEATRTAAQAFQERQRPITEAFAPFTRWLERAAHPSIPDSAEEWSAFAEMHYFGERLSQPVEPVWLSDESLDSAVQTASLEALADVSFALHEGGSAARWGQTWLDRNRHELTRLARLGLGGLNLSDDGESLTLDYIVSSRRGSVDLEVAADYNGQSVTRLDLVRRLFPDREYYAAQGWGHRVSGIAFDGTEKRIPRASLPPLWLTSLNANLRGYIEHWWRPATWSSYRDDLKEFRRSNCSRLEVLAGALERFHRGAATLQMPGASDEAWFQTWRSQLTKGDLLPSEAVDAYGFSDESWALAEIGRSGVQVVTVAIQPYVRFIKARRDLTRALSNFANHAPSAMVLSTALGRAPASSREALRLKAAEVHIERMPRLSSQNLGDALKALPAFQADAGRLFGSADEDRLREREQRAMHRALGGWRHFVGAPWSRTTDVHADAERHRRRLMEGWQRAVAARVAPVDSGVTWQLKEELGSDGGRLLVTGSGTDAVAVYSGLGGVASALHEVLSTLEADDQSLVEAYLPQIVVVPLVRGRSLRGEAIALSTVVVASEGWTPEWWNFAPRPFPPDQRRPFDVWESGDLRLGRELTDSFATLFATLTHLVDLPRREDLDSLGRDLMDEHVRSQVPSLIDIQQEIGGRIDRLAGALAQVEESTRYRRDLGELLSALRATLDAAPAELEPRSVPHAELRRWLGQIEEAVPHATLAWLAWSTNVLDRQRLVEADRDRAPRNVPGTAARRNKR